MSQLVIIGGIGLTQVGQALHAAAIHLQLPADQIDHSAAFAGPRLLRSAVWRLCGHRPLRLGAFSTRIEAYCQQHRPALLISTGTSPIQAKSIERIRAMGVICANFSTDDPFSRSNGAWHFNSSLPLYDWVFTPRRANLAELQQRCKNVAYLPFGFEARHCIGPEPDESQRSSLYTQVLLVGGADAERTPIARAVVGAGHSLALYGGYWDKDPSLRAHWRGHAQPEVLRCATLSADVVLCLVRRANRDGHVMRSFEAGAIGACMLVEDTSEHREIFGADGANVVYFQDDASMLRQLRRLLDDAAERRRLQLAVRTHIRAGAHSYRDRLLQMLAFAAPKLIPCVSEKTPSKP